MRPRARCRLRRDGDRIVITAGVPFGTPGTTNVLRIARLGTSTAERPAAPGEVRL